MYDVPVFEDLARAVEELNIPDDGTAIAEAFALRDRLDAKLAAAVARFDAAGQWDVDGATSLAGRLRDRAGRSRRDAGRTATTATRLAALPVTAKAFTDGHLTGGQIEAVAAQVGADIVERFAADVVPGLVGLSVEETADALAAWKARSGSVEVGGEPARDVHLSMALDGRWELHGRLDPIGGQTVATALRVAERRDAEGEPARRPARRRADALVDLCRYFLDHHGNVPAGRHRPHLNVVVDLEALDAGRGGRFVGGGPVDPASVGALLCDSSLHRVLTAGRSAILDYGHATRTIPAPLWNAVVLRDQHCRFPGCDRPYEWCEAHHVVPVEAGGPTRLDNLVLGCSRDHHRLHLPGWHAKLLPDGTLEVTDPNGRVRTSRPPGIAPLLC